MKYKSTRDGSIKINAADAIVKGISNEGGLFVPDSFPEITLDDIEGLSQMNYIDRAVEILSLFLTDFSDEQLVACVKGAYTDSFESDCVTEISALSDGRYMLELWHGPTCAFKDMALQLLPYLMTTSAKIVGNQNELIVLVATSGDTGKAALEGFKDVENTRIIVFYPVDGVSPMQKRQMTTQKGENVDVCAINGNFDDAQTAVKAIFTDKELAEKMKTQKMQFSSANSINWGRLVPQIVYYISAYADLVADKEIALGDRVNVCVPTGNFGNILAAYYAKKMGLPIEKLICASNKNKVLADFITSGVYDRNREFYETLSPSMDILISSNLERLLFDLSGEDDKLISKLYSSLKENGRFEINSQMMEKLQSEFYGGWCDDDAVKATIKESFEKYSYLLDTHTAVAVKVYDDYKKKTGDDRKTIVVSTASPYKFADSVYSALFGGDGGNDEFERIEKLEAVSGLEVPQALNELKQAVPRFNEVIEKEAVMEKVRRALNI